MTNKKCEGIDCAWCMSVECPREKDTTMTDKEQIIIDGRKRDCKILFRCKHIDDTAAYDMMCEGIEIKPENAPVSDFELMLIENTNSPFGFSLVFKGNNKEDVWRQSGFGNSGACSIVTALLKAHEMGLKRIFDLEERIIRHADEIEEYCSRLADKEQECEELKDARFNLNCEIYSLNRYRKALEEIEKAYEITIKNITTYDEQNDINVCIEALHNISDIINKAKEQ